MRIWKLVILFVLAIILAAYFAYQRGFEVGRDYTAQMDSVNPKNWVNKKWGYEVTFPKQWDNIKRNDRSIKTTGADVFCSSKMGASTAIFVLPVIPSNTIDNISDEVIGNYKKLGEVAIIDKKDYNKGNVLYRNIVFKQSDFIEYYTIILTDKIVILVSSNCKNDGFDYSKNDFKEIVDSIKFF